jgi:hypothetical protein
MCQPQRLARPCLRWRLTRLSILLTLELTLTLRRFLRKLLLLEQRRATTAKLPLLLGRQPRVLQDEKPLRL